MTRSFFFWLIAFPLSASLAIEITDITTSGCEIAPIKKLDVSSKEAFYFEAEFKLAAVASDELLAKERCTLNYNLKLSPGFKMDSLALALNGAFHLSEHGTARVSISHRVLNSSSHRTTKFYQASLDDPASVRGDIKDFMGALAIEELPEEYLLAGATIPVSTTIFVEALKPKSDSQSSQVHLSKLAITATAKPEPSAKPSNASENNSRY